MGSSHVRTLWRAILPSCLPAITVLLSFSIANAILYESGLSFLGLGAQPPQPSWGTMLSSAKSYMFDDPWYTAIVGVTLSATIIALNLVGDAIRGSTLSTDCGSRSRSPGEEMTWASDGNCGEGRTIEDHRRAGHHPAPAEMDVSKADGSQDALLIRIETDAGITGFGEVDSLPPVVKAIVDAPPSHAIASGLRHLLIGENPLEIDRLWQKLYRGSIDAGRQGDGDPRDQRYRHRPLGHQGKALGQPIYRLLGGPHRTAIRAYASTLMPETPEETATSWPDRWTGFTAIKLGWGPAVVTPISTSR